MSLATGRAFSLLGVYAVIPMLGRLNQAGEKVTAEVITKSFSAAGMKRIAESKVTYNFFTVFYDAFILPYQLVGCMCLAICYKDKNKHRP